MVFQDDACPVSPHACSSRALAPGGCGARARSQSLPGFTNSSVFREPLENPGFAREMAKPTETLKNMNTSTSKHASWVVRVVSQKVVKYTFTAKGKQIQAQKFECLLVGANPLQFILGIVPFSFAEQDAAQKASQKFKEGTCWRIDQPDFDTKTKPEYISTSVKRAVLLTKPTQISPVPLTDVATLKEIAHHIDIGLTLKEVLDRQKMMLGPQALLGYGSSAQGRPTQLLNMIGKVKTVTVPKGLTLGGKQRNVSSLELVDQTGALVELSVWDDANDLLRGLKVGDGVTIIGASTQRDSSTGDVRMSLWESAHVVQGSPLAQTLSRWDVSGQKLTKLTSTFTASGPLIPVDSEGIPTCAAALANAPKLESERIVQINRCIIDLPTRQELIFTQDGQRLYSTGRLRDWSGGVDVDLVSEAMLTLYDLPNQDEVQAALDNGTLTTMLSRVNARGVLRPTETGTKILIGKIEKSPLDAAVSPKALRDMLGLSEVLGDIILPVPAASVLDLSGLAVETSANGCIMAHRVLLLVKGTSSSMLVPTGEGQSLTTQTFRVSSPKVKCLLSETDVFVNLYGYCAFDNMLQYRLDQDVALVLASAVDINPDTQEKTFTVEKIEKVQHWEAVKSSLEQEWQTVLLNRMKTDTEEYSSPQKAEYWDRDVKRLKRMSSEPTR